jgi:hypothetical protein
MLRSHKKNALGMLLKSFVVASAFCLMAFSILVAFDNGPRRMILSSEVSSDIDPLDKLADQEISRYKPSSRSSRYQSAYIAGIDGQDEPAAVDPDIEKLISESRTIGKRVNAVTSHDPYSHPPDSIDQSSSQNHVIKIRFNRSIRPTGTESDSSTSADQAKPFQDSEIESSKSMRIERIRGEDERATEAENAVAGIVSSDPNAFAHNQVNPNIVKILQSEPHQDSMVHHPQYSSSRIVQVPVTRVYNPRSNYFAASASNSPIPVSASSHPTPGSRYQYAPPGLVKASIPYTAGSTSRIPSSYSRVANSPQPSRWAPAESAQPPLPSFQPAVPANPASRISSPVAKAQPDPAPAESEHSPLRPSWALRIPGTVTVDHIVLPSGTYQVSLPGTSGQAEPSGPTAAAQVARPTP